MKIYEEKSIVETKRVLTKITCDICKKEIQLRQNYYNVTTSHNDWGNDSHESIKYKEICSDECLKKEFDIYLQLESNTKSIEIEKATLTKLY